MYRAGRSVEAQLDRLSSGHSCTLFFLLDIAQRCTVQRTVLLLLGFLLYISGLWIAVGSLGADWIIAWPCKSREEKRCG
jgi:hypothetical protein